MILIARAGGHRQLRERHRPEGPPLRWTEIPVLDLVPCPGCRGALGQALEGGESWVLITSAHTVDILARSPEENIPWKSTEASLGRHHLAAIGEATAQSLRDRGFACELVAPESTSRSLVTAVVEKGARRIVWPGNLSGDRSALELAAQVPTEFVGVYREDPEPGGIEEVREAIEGARQGGAPEGLAVGFSSPEAASAVLGEARLDGPWPEFVVGALGQLTARTVGEMGFDRIVVPPETRIASLAEALERTLQGN